MHIAGPEDIDLLIPTYRVLRRRRSSTQLQKILQTRIKDPFRVIYLRDDRQIVAMACFRTIQAASGGKTFYLETIVTQPDHRKKGYGSTLLQWMIQYAKEKGYDHFSLDAGQEHIEAHRLYIRYGLQNDGTHFSNDVRNL